jgi:hypothetical protein
VLNTNNRSERYRRVSQTAPRSTSVSKREHHRCDSFSTKEGRKKGGRKEGRDDRLDAVNQALKVCPLWVCQVSGIYQRLGARPAVPKPNPSCHAVAPPRPHVHRNAVTQSRSPAVAQLQGCCMSTLSKGNCVVPPLVTAASQ